MYTVTELKLFGGLGMDETFEFVINGDGCDDVCEITFSTPGEKSFKIELTSQTEEKWAHVEMSNKQMVFLRDWLTTVINSG